MKQQQNSAIMTREKFLSRTYQSEDVFTADTNMYISHNYPALRGLYFHVPNESATSDKMRLKLAAMGVLSGVPDFIFVHPKISGMELKVGVNKLSKKQEALHDRWHEKEITVVTVWTPAGVIKFMTAMYGQPKYS